MFDFRSIRTIDLATCIQVAEDSKAFDYYDPTVDRHYILKTFETIADDFYLEAEFRKIMALSAEPEICSVYGLVTVTDGKKRKSGYLMDFIQGQNLGQYLAANPSISYDVYVDFLQQIISGMEKAHRYGIVHNDLTVENIMIDAFNSVKIIDFLWNDYGSQQETAVTNDIQNFKKIEEALFDRLDVNDRSKAQLITNHCAKISSFKNSAYAIKNLREISFELSYLNEIGITVLRYLLTHIPANYKLKNLYVINYGESELFHRIVPELTDEHKRLVEENKQSEVYNKEFLFKKMIHLDTRQSEFEDNVQSHFVHIFHQLNQANLCSFMFTVHGQQPFLGPYFLSLRIDVTIKLLRWQKLNNQICFLEPFDKDEFKSLLVGGEWYWKKLLPI